MAAFRVSDLGRIIAHPAKGMTWSKGGIIIKRASFPKGATPSHLVAYRDKFTQAAHDCKSAIKKGLGAATVQGFNECIKGKLK